MKTGGLRSIFKHTEGCALCGVVPFGRSAEIVHLHDVLPQLERFTGARLELTFCRNRLPGPSNEEQHEPEVRDIAPVAAGVVQRQPAYALLESFSGIRGAGFRAAVKL